MWVHAGKTFAALSAELFSLNLRVVCYIIKWWTVVPHVNDNEAILITNDADERARKNEQRRRGQGCKHTFF